MRVRRGVAALVSIIALAVAASATSEDARTIIRQGLGRGEPENALRQLMKINDSIAASARARQPRRSASPGGD